MKGYFRIILIVCVYKFTSINCTQYNHIWGLDNFLPPTITPPLEEPDVYSVTDCARKCAGYNGTCLSYFYIDSSPPVCHLQSVRWNSTISLDSVPQSKYYMDQDGLYHHPYACPTPSEYTSVTLSDGTIFTYKFYLAAPFNQTHSYNHTEAFELCAGENARLAQVTTLAKLEMAYQIRNECLVYSAIWIDGNNIDATDYTDNTQWVTSNVNATYFSDLSLWETTTNIPLNPIFWHSGQPNMLASDHCIYLWLLDEGPAMYADALCSQRYGVLCEK